jgi:hypothetical protein
MYQPGYSTVAVLAWASPRARDEVSPVDQGMTEVDVGRGRPGSRAAYGRPSQPPCQPPRRGLGSSLTLVFRFPSVVARDAAAMRRGRGASLH